MSETTLTEAQAAKLARVPERLRAMYREAVTKNRRQLSQRVFCCECTGWVAAEVRRCTSRGCPLYPYRLGGHPGAEDPTQRETGSKSYGYGLDAAESTDDPGNVSQDDPPRDRPLPVGGAS